MTMKQIEVTILGQSYLLGCPEGGEAGLRDAVAMVDREMIAIKDSGKVRARERIAVLAALNLAYALTGRGARAADPAPVAAERAEDRDVAPGHTLDRLIRQLDHALAADGHPVR